MIKAPEPYQGFLANRMHFEDASIIFHPGYSRNSNYCRTDWSDVCSRRARFAVCVSIESACYLGLTATSTPSLFEEINGRIGKASLVKTEVNDQTIG